MPSRCERAHVKRRDSAVSRGALRLDSTALSSRCRSIRGLTPRGEGLYGYIGQGGGVVNLSQVDGPDFGGKFIAFVSNLSSRALLHEALASFRRHGGFPSEGVAAPAFIPGVDWSDHWSFRQEGWPALMVTDTAPYRYPHYHSGEDTTDKVDYERLAQVVTGLHGMLRERIRVP